mgnify:CR=1 FL=1
MSVSDVVWEPLQMVLTGQFDEDANDGSWKIPTSHTNLTKIKNVDDSFLVAQLRKVLACTLTLKQFNIECQLYKVREKIYAQNWSMLRSYLSADEQLALDAVDGQYWEKLAAVTGPFPAWETCIEEIVQGHKSAKLSAMRAGKRATSAAIAGPPGIRMEDLSVHLLQLEKEQATWRKKVNLVPKPALPSTSEPWR